jgi:1,4-dihydroxy-2-naphthoate octaprenyltransferase
LKYREETMQTFSVLIASLGVLAALSYFFSLWAAFGFVYMLGMLLVVIVALFRRKSRQPAWRRESVPE